MTLYKQDAISISVGERVRELRVSRKMTLQRLARMSGLSIHTLSMIEHGKNSPSISALYKLANALGVSITVFFGTDSEWKHVIFIKSDERTRVSFTRGLFEGLGGEQFVGNVEPFLITLENGANSGPQMIEHSGHEFVFCLRGQLEYQVENQLFELSPGDSLLFAAHLKHRWKNPGRVVTTALVVVSGFAEGEKLHGGHHEGSEQE